MAYILVIDGQAGAGKTPLIEYMDHTLKSKGYRTHVAAPFAAVRAMLKDNTEYTAKYLPDIYYAWLESEASALWAESWLEDYIETESSKDVDIIIFDRGWLTVCMGISESPLSQEVQVQKIQYWMNKNVPTFFLDTHPNITQSRKTWNPVLPWTNENIHEDFYKRRETIQRYQNLKDRFVVEETRIDLQQLGDRWINIILQDMHNASL